MRATSPALALLEFADTPTGAWCMDAMLKRAPIARWQAGAIGGARYLALVNGSVAAVEEALHEGLRQGEDRVLDHLLLPDAHPALHTAAFGARSPVTDESMAWLQTDSAPALFRAGERALKGVPIALLELRYAAPWLHGQALACFQGPLHELQAGLAIAETALREQGRAACLRILPRPHEAWRSASRTSLFYAETQPAELEEADAC